MTVSPLGPRLLPVQGLPNVRDAGGLATPRGGRVRRRLLLRGPAPDPSTACRLDDHGVRTIVDLRTDDERARQDGPAHCRAHVLPRPVAGDMTRVRGTTRPGPAEYRHNYRSMVPVAAPVAVEILGLLGLRGGAAAPVYVCCTVGKDRTGVVSALVLRALGVGLAEIGADYALSGRSYRRLRPGDPRPAWADAYPVEELHRRTASPAAVVVDVLTEIEARHGSVRAYLSTGHGLSDEVLRSAVGHTVHSPKPKEVSRR